MFAKRLREDTEFGDGSDTAEAITRLIINSPSDLCPLIADHESLITTSPLLFPLLT
jgi:hypothetical protein